MPPLFVTTAASAEAVSALESVASLEMVPRNCGLTPYDKIKVIKSFDITNTFIAYASPDSTYAVTRRLFDNAKKEIIIGIYDFTAEYIKELVLNAMQRGVKVSLMLDIDMPDEKNHFYRIEEVWLQNSTGTFLCK